MKKYIPFIYIPLMLVLIVRLNMEINEPVGSIVLGMTRQGLLRFGIVVSELILYVLFKKFKTPKYLVVFVLALLAFPQPLWIISNVIIKIFSFNATYLLHGPYTFVGMTLLLIEILELIKSRFKISDKHFT